MRAGLAALLLACAASCPRAEPAPWSLPPEESAEPCLAALRKAATAVEAVARLPSTARSFVNTPEALENALQDLEDEAAPVTLLSQVSLSTAARDAGARCRAETERFLAETFARQDLYDALSGYAGRREPLAEENGLLVRRQLEEFRRAGAALGPQARNALANVRQQEAEYERLYLENLEWPVPTLQLEPEELAGLPPDLAASLPLHNGRRLLSATPAAYRRFMAAAQDDGARKRVEFAFHNRAEDTNTPVLKGILELRRREAGLLGRISYAQLLLSRSMLPEPAQARAVLEKLRRTLAPAARRTLADLAALQAGRSGEPADRLAPAWTRPYLIEMLREPVDEAAIAEYFPATGTVRASLDVLEGLLALSLQPARETQRLWHPDARLHEVRDAESGELLGRFILDLRARSPKPDRPEVFVLSRGRRLPDGRQRVPLVAVLAGWPVDAPGRPASLRHGRRSDLEDFFHAMGHALAALLSRSRYGMFSGADLSPDFAEVPALVLGRLAWEPEVAARVSGRARDRSRRLPADLLRRAATARAAGAGLDALEETAFALFDLQAHSGAAGGDPGSLYRSVFRRVALLPVTPGTRPENSRPRLVARPLEAAQRVVAALAAEEVWRRLKEDGLSNPIAGRRLRSLLLEPGAGREAESLRRYLGRRPRLGADAPSGLNAGCASALGRFPRRSAEAPSR